MKLLSLADLHLGRTAARLHPELRPQAHELGPAAAWRRATQFALREGVDAVLLAGDLVHGDGDYFEAYSELYGGVRTLLNDGVNVVCVAGNHDVDVLPRLTRELSGVTLLGAGGRWEARCVPSRCGAHAVRVVGWSFPERRVTRSPLEGADLSAALLAAAPPHGASVAATFGLLHADVGGTGGPYAPVKASELAEAPVDAWLLGHVHAPSFAPSNAGGPAFSGYLGSTTATHPGELGPLGGWLITVNAGKRSGGEPLRARHAPFAPLRWERLEVDITELMEPGEVSGAVVRAVTDLSDRLVNEGANPLAVGCRLELTGRSSIRGEIAKELAKTDLLTTTLDLGDTQFFFDSWSVTAQPRADLRALARTSDPAGLLAQRILALQEPGSETGERLIAAARRAVASARSRREFAGLPEELTSDAELRDRLTEVALKAMDELLAQRADNGSGSP